MKLKSAEIETTVARKFVGSTRSVLRKEYKDAITYLAPTAKKMLWYCGAKLTYTLERWGDWKMQHYPNGEWIYLRLIDFCTELIGEHSIYCIRASLELLEEIGLITIRRNWRYINDRNGQDRTYQYRLNRERLFETVALVENEGQTAQSHISSRIGKLKHPELAVESPMLLAKHSKPNVASHTQIPYTDSCTDSCTLSETGEEFFEEFSELAKELSLDGSVTTNSVDYLAINENSDNEVETFLKQQISHESQFSAAPRGFTSIEERDNFYIELFELAKHKSGVLSPVSWTGALMKSIAKGEPCIYLDEFRRGEKVGTCEQREWEIAPGRPYDNFMSYLERKLQPNHATPEQALQAAFKLLADVNQARMQWNGYLRHLVNLEQEWEKQKALGVSTPYIPPEVLPQKEVSVERAAAALANLVQASQINAIAPEETVTEEPVIAPEETVTEEPAVALEETVTEEPVIAPEETVNEQPAVALEETVNEQPVVALEETVSEEPAVASEETVSEEQVPEETVNEQPAVAPEETEDERHQRVFALIAAHNIMLRYPKNCDFVQHWVEQNSDLVRFNEEGLIVAIANEQVPVTAADESGTQTDESNTSTKDSSSPAQQAQVKAAKKFIGERPATGLVGRKLEMIAPGTEVEETGELHSRDDVIYVKPVGCDWATGIQVHVSLLE